MKPATLARALLSATAVLLLGGVATRSLLAGMQVPSRTQLDRRLTGPQDSGRAHVAALGGLSVSSVTGPVERRSNENEPWRPVQVGETISLNELLRTGSGGAAVLELQDRTSIWLWPESQVTAEILGDELSRVGLAGGRLDLNVPVRAQRNVEVHAPDGATARTSGARFSIIVDGAHVATVATHEGEVDVVSGSGSVRVPPGMQTRARPGEAPEVVMPIPSNLLLQVDWPAENLRSRTALLHGRAPAGVLVSVSGASVIVPAEGTFTAPLSLAEGVNHVQVSAVDVMGRHEARESPAIHVDTHPPVVGAHGRWE